MSDSAKRKIKLVLLYEILLKQMDELHPMTTSEIFTALQESGIAVSRQTLYEDIEVLNRYGFHLHHAEQPYRGELFDTDG